MSQTRAASKNMLKEFSYRNEIFKYSFFPVCARESNNFGNSMCGAKSIKQFKLMSIKEISFSNQKKRSLFSMHDQMGIKLLKRLQQKFSDSSINYVIISKIL